MTTGQLITAAREARELSTAALARACGVSRQHMHRIEHDTPISPELVESLAAALDLNRDQLYASAGLVPRDIAAAFADGTHWHQYPKIRRTLGLKG